MLELMKPNPLENVIAELRMRVKCAPDVPSANGRLGRSYINSILSLHIGYHSTYVADKEFTESSCVLVAYRSTICHPPTENAAMNDCNLVTCYKYKVRVSTSFFQALLANLSPMLISL